MEPLDGKRALAVVLCTALGGSVLGLFVVPRAPNDAVDEEAPSVHFLGKPLPTGDDAHEATFSRARNFTRQTVSLDLGDGKFASIPLTELGAEVDQERLEHLLDDVSDPRSPLRRRYRDIARGDVEVERDHSGKDASHDLPLPLRFDAERATSRLIALKDDFDRTPHSARVDLEKKAVVPHVVGRTLDVDATFATLVRHVESGELRAKAVFVSSEPKKKTADLEGLSFERVLGWFETRYSRAEKDEDRTYNLRLAASRLDGTVLLPGETFDFNDVVGARDEASGYKVATVIADGELVDGIGGGTCQVSGTLHGATFFAGLDIVERYPHTRPSSYIKMGMDATVVYPTINFRVKNPFDFPVVIHQTVRGGVVRAEVLGPALDQVVTLIRKIDEALPYEEVERPDPKLARGERVLAQRGIAGFRLHRYRIVRRGSHTVRERWRDVYPPTAQVVRVGTGGGASEAKAKSVATPEYLADELLVLTLKRPSDGAVGDFAENREPGKYGVPGWTQAEAMPYFAD